MSLLFTLLIICVTKSMIIKKTFNLWVKYNNMNTSIYISLKKNVACERFQIELKVKEMLSDTFYLNI